MLLRHLEPRVDRSRFLASVVVNPPQRRAAPMASVTARAATRSCARGALRASRVRVAPAALGPPPSRTDRRARPPTRGARAFPRTYDTACGVPPLRVPSAPRPGLGATRRSRARSSPPGTAQAVHCAPGLRLARRVRVQNRGRPRALPVGLRDGLRRALRHPGRSARARAALRRDSDRDGLARNARVAVRRGPANGTKSDGLAQRRVLWAPPRWRRRRSPRSQGSPDPCMGVGAAANGDGWKLAAALVAKNVGGHELRGGLRHAGRLARRVQRGRRRG